MKLYFRPFLLFTLFMGILLCLSCKTAKNENNSETNKPISSPLPSFNEGVAKSNILDFIKNVTDPKSPYFVKAEDRIVCFDNDGTLWAEQPVPSQTFFAIDRIKALSKDHPEWNTTFPFAAILKNDIEGLKKISAEDVLQIAGYSEAIENVDDFSPLVNNWLKTAQHPVLKRPISKCVYQPMLELLDYLRSNNFTIYIVSGGSMEFMRAFAPKVYGVPVEKVIGTTFKREAVQIGDVITIKQTTEFEFNDDHIGKALNINKFIGKKPIMIVGNSDGDLEMMEYATTNNPLPTFCLYINHDDAQREFDYSQGYKLGLLIKGKTEALRRGWTIVNIKEDWNKVFPDL